MEKNSIEWLKKNGFAGLYNFDERCGCSLDDLAPCGETTEDCHPGFKHLDTRAGHKEFGDFCISSTKEDPSESEWENMY